MSLVIDVLAIQEVRRVGHGHIVFDDESIKGWQLIWIGHELKKEHGVGILLAPPYVDLDDCHEHLKARIVSENVAVKGMRLLILNS